MFIGSKITEWEREKERAREESGAVETKVITSGKIVPHKRCLPSLNISMKDFYADVLHRYLCHTFSDTVCNVTEHGQKVNKHNILCKMSGV